MLIKSLKKYTLTSLALCFVLYSCSSTKDMSRNQTKDGHTELYSYPNMIEPSEKDGDRFKRLIVVGINDFNGQLYPTRTELTEIPEGKRFIYSGGIAAAKSYLDILHTQFKDQVLSLDAGSFLNKRSDHKETVFYYNHLGIDFVNLGTNEFNLETKWRNYPGYLAHLFKAAKFKVISSNIQDLSTGEKADWRFLNPSLIKEINGIKVGIIGVNSQRNAHDNKTKKLNGIYFQNMAKTIILDANRLRKNGAQVVILMASHGIDCTSLLAHNLNLPKEKVNFKPEDISGCENTKNELIKTLSLLPPNKIDIVISSGKDSKVANKFYTMPVLQNFTDGQYLSWAELYYDTKYFRVAKEKSRVHQPIKLCHKFLEGSDDCFVEKEDLKKDPVKAKFLEKEVIIGTLPNL